MSKKKTTPQANERNQETTSPPIVGEHNPPVIRDRRALESTLFDLHRLLETKEFKNVDEANAFLAEVTRNGGRIVAPPAATPLERAQDVVYEGWWAEGKKRGKVAQQGVESCPAWAVAYVLLAEESAQTMEEAHTLYTKAVAAGERALGPQAFNDLVGAFWGIMETRPYMRARHGLANSLWELGHRDAAIAHYQDMLRLNPGDNQGVRYVLLAKLILMERDSDATNLLARHPDDPTADWHYSRALLAFRSGGDSPQARALLSKALEVNPFVPLYMSGAKQLPSDIPDRIGFGDESEAQVYLVDYGTGWIDSPGAPEWLGSTLTKDPEAMDRVAAAALSSLSFEDIKSDINRKWRKDQDAKAINLDTKLQAALNKCPAPWIEGMAATVGSTRKGIKRDKIAAIVAHLTNRDKLKSAVSSLPPQGRAALLLALKKGWVKYGELTRRFGTDEGDGWFWDEQPPTSVLGQLRVRGLLFVGTAGISGRNYKVAVVASELRSLLQALLMP